MKTIKIGDQVWSTKNLDVDHYRNGDIIPEVQDPEEWKNLKIGAWCYYDNNSENGKKYGKLYNWYAVNDKRGLAPEGWHIPTEEEFGILMSEVNNDDNSLKAEGETIVVEPFRANKSGFSALLSGYRFDNGLFFDLGYHFYCWSSTAYDETYAITFFLYYENGYIGNFRYHKEDGFSVRVVQDK